MIGGGERSRFSRAIDLIARQAAPRNLREVLPRSCVQLAELLLRLWSVTRTIRHGQALPPVSPRGRLQHAAEYVRWDRIGFVGATARKVTAS
jgi:hypothetical protein